MTQEPAKTRSRWRRWWVIALMVVVGILILAAVTVQIVLWTNLPRDLVQKELEKQLGLRVSAGSLSTGWLGHTSLKDVTLGLPLSDEAFLQIPEMKVSHTSLLGLALGQAVEVKSVTMRGPTVTIRQDADGSWNLEQAAKLVARASGGTDAQQQKHESTPAVKLPELEIVDATIHVIDNEGREARVEPLNVKGTPKGPLVYEYQLNAPGHVDATGRVVPRGVWRHEVALKIQNLQPWVDAWVKNWPAPVTVEAGWTGELADGGIAGRLTLEGFQVRDYQARGVIDLHSAGSTVNVLPQRLSVEVPQGGVQRVDFLGGQVQLRGATVQLDHLTLALAGGRLQMDGQIVGAPLSAKVTAAWEDLNIPQGALQNGHLQASVSTPWPDRPRMALELTSQGRLAGGAYQTQVQVQGEGQSWTEIDWTVALGKLNYEGSTDIRLHDLTARIRQRGEEIFLDRVEMPAPGTVAGQGYINLARTFGTEPTTRAASQPTTQPTGASWYVWMDGADWQVPKVVGAPMRFVFNSWGTPEQIVLEQAYAALGDLQASASGSYEFDRPKPLDVNVYLLNVPTLLSEDAQAPPVRGKLSGEAHVSGTLKPRLLEIDGRLHGEDVVLMDRDVGDVQVMVTGKVTAEKGTLRSEQLQLLGGAWTFWAVYPNEPEVLRVGVEVSGLSLAEAGELVGMKGASGALSGQWDLDMPQLQRERLRVVGKYDVTDARLNAFAADTIQGSTTLWEDVFKLTGRFRRGDGQADLKLSGLVSRPRQLSLSFEAASWPLESGEGDLLVSAHAQDVTIDLTGPGATGTIEALIAGYYHDQSLGKLTLKTRLGGRQVHLEPIGGDLLGGRVSGALALNLDRPLETRGWLEWESIETARLGLIWEVLKPLTGKFSGRVHIAPSDEPRALGPLKVTLNVAAEEGRFNALHIGDVAAVAYAALSEGTIPRLERFVLDDGKFALADGTLDVWGRVTRHAGDVLSSQIIVSFARLDLDQLVHAIKPEEKPMPGRLGGRFTGVGSVHDLSRLYAEGVLTLTESDLGNFGPIAALYNAMHLGVDQQSPTGEGTIQVRMEGGQIIVPWARYFNRGVEAVATAKIENVALGKAAGVEATIVGSARPLKDVKLPFAADADQIFQAIQTSVTTVQVTGTLDGIKWAIVPFQEVGESLRELLFGEVGGK